MSCVKLQNVAASRQTRLPSAQGPMHRPLRSLQSTVQSCQIVLQANSGDASEPWPSSKLVNRNSKQKRFKGKDPKADWEQSIGKVRRKLRNAVMKSCSCEDEILVRAVARAFFDSEAGLQDCAARYLLLPVSYSSIAWYIRQSPETGYDDNASSSPAVGDIAADEHETHAVDDNDEVLSVHGGHDATNDMPDLSVLLEDQRCQQKFSVLHSPDSNQQISTESQPYVIADLHALIQGYHLQKVQDLLPQIQALTVHPADPAYATELKRLAAAPQTAKKESQNRVGTIKTRAQSA